MLCLMLAACNSNETSSTYKSFICDYAADGLISYYTERDWWLKGDETNLSAPMEKRATFDGADYYSVYANSSLPFRRHNKRDKYITEDGKIELSFDSFSGRFSGIFFSRAIVEKYDNADVENSHDKALEKAKLLASRYIELDEYVLTETQYPYYKDGEENTKIGQLGEGRVIVYDFTFTKEQNGFDTSDSVVVSITSKGDLRLFHALDTGLFSQREVPEINKDELSKSIDEKLKKIYSKYEYSYEIVKQTLTLSPEEKTIVVSQIELEVADTYRTGITLETEIE